MNTKQPVSFPGWKGALALSNLAQVVLTSHTRQILTFLRHCKQTHSPATAELMKQWLGSREPDPNGPAHLALRWFYRAARKAGPREVTGSDLAVVPSARVVGPDTRMAVASASPETETGVQEKSAEGESAQRAGRSTFKRGTYHERPPTRPMEPRPAAQDLGGPGWEPRIASHAVFAIGVS